eukprot:164180-Pelagomonas_calceolata.AAC.2
MEILLSPHSKKKPPRLEKEFLRRLGEEGTKLNCRKYRQGLLKVKGKHGVPPPQQSFFLTLCSKWCCRLQSIPTHTHTHTPARAHTHTHTHTQGSQNHNISRYQNRSAYSSRKRLSEVKDLLGLGTDRNKLYHGWVPAN